MMAVAVGFFLFLGIHTLWHLETVLGWDEPRRSLKLVMAATSLFAGGLVLWLTVRDLRGKAAPVSASLKPAWIVVGLNLLHAHATHAFLPLLVAGFLGLAVGAWGTFGLVVRLLRKD